MALTGIKLKIGIQLETGDINRQIASMMNSIQSQMSKGLNLNLNAQLPRGNSTQPTTSAKSAASRADPALVNQLSTLNTSINTLNRSLNRPQQPRGPRGPAAGPPGVGGGGGGGAGGGGGTRGAGGGGGPHQPPGLGQGFRGTGAKDRGFLGVVRDVAAYRVASRATNALFSTFDRGVGVVSEVQQEMTQLNKILTTNKAGLDSLKRAAIDTAKEYGKTTTSVLQGFRVFAQQGLPAEEVKKLGKTVALASNVSTFDTEGLSELITAGRKTFGDDEVGSTGLKLIDKFLAVEGARAVSEADLADVFKRIGPQAATAGISIDELNAVTTVMKERTRSSSGEIATSMRFIIKNLQDSRTQKNIKAIEGLEDIKFTDESGDLRGSYAVLEDIAQRLPQLNRRGKLGVATEIGETRFASRTIALLEGLQAGEGKSVIDISRGASGETFKRNQIVMQSINKQAEQVGASFDALALSLGNSLVEPTKVALGTVREILDLLTQASEFKLFGDKAPSTGIEDADSKTEDNTFNAAKIIAKAGIVSSGPTGGLGNTSLQALSSIYSFVRSKTENSADRADREGITDKAVKGGQIVDFADSQLRSLEELETLSKQRVTATTFGDLKAQRAAVDSGELDRTAPEIDELVKERKLQSKEALLRNDILIEKMGGKVVNANKILFKNNQGELANIFEDDSAMKNLLVETKKAGTLREREGTTASLFNSFASQVASATKDPGGTSALTLEAIKKQIAGKPLTDIDEFFLEQERESGKVTDELAASQIAAAKKILTAQSGQTLQSSLNFPKLGDKQTFASLLATRTGSEVNEGDLNAENIGTTIESLISKLSFQEILRDSEKFQDNILHTFQSASDSAQQISEKLEKADPGTLIKATLKDGSKIAGRVAEDEIGNKFIEVISEMQGGYSAGRQSVGDFANNLATAQLTKPRIKTEQNAFELLEKDIALTGFGAGRALSRDALKVGPESLSEMSSQAAGAFVGFSKGVPQFNKAINSFLTNAEIEREALEKDLGNEAAENAPTRERLAAAEAKNIIGTAITKLGDVFKQFSGSVDKLLQFRIDKVNAKAFATVQTGEFAKQFGNAVPQVSLGADKADLDPLQRALLLLPNQARRKEESDFSLNNLKQVADTVAFSKSKLSELIATASSDALSTINLDEVKKLLSPTFSSGTDREAQEATLSKIVEGVNSKNLGPLERRNKVENLSQFFNERFSGFEQTLKAQASGLQNRSATDEAALKSAAALSQLQIAAEQSGRALQALERFQGFDQALVRARGDGPLGAVNQSTQPVFFKEIEGNLRQLNFTGKNQFEIEKEMLRLRSSEDVRSGNTRILDSSGQALTPISDEQRRFELRSLKIRESQARGGFEVGRQRQQLETNQQLASDFIGRIGETLATKELNPNARVGLESIQKDLIGISTRPETDFISKTGEINLEPFDVLKGLDQRIEGLAGSETPVVGSVNAVGGILNSHTALLQAIAVNTSSTNTSRPSTPAEMSQYEGLSNYSSKPSVTESAASSSGNNYSFSDPPRYPNEPKKAVGSGAFRKGVGEQVSKALDSSGEGVAQKIESAFSSGGNAVAESLTSAFGSLGNTLKSIFESKTVGGASVATADILSALTERVSSIEATTVQDMEALKEGINSDFNLKLTELDSKLAQLKDGSNTSSNEELRREATRLISELSNLKSSVVRSSQSTNTSEQEVTTLKSQIVLLESRLVEAASMAQKALGLATTAWGNAR